MQTGQGNGGGRTFLWGEVIEVFLGDLFSLALFLSLAAISVVRAALDCAFLLGGALLFVGVARLVGRGREVLLGGCGLLTLAVLGHVCGEMRARAGRGGGHVPSSSDESSEPSPKMSRSRVCVCGV